MVTTQKFCGIFQRMLVAATVLFAAELLSPLALALNAVDGFNPDADNAVFASAVQPDGMILIGGDFTTLNGGAKARNHIARLNVDGSVDDSFDPVAIGAVDALAVQPDGNILVGGGFSSIAGTGNPYLMRLRADGSADSNFKTFTLGTLDNSPPSVSAVIVQADGYILVGGHFTQIAYPGASTYTRNGILRLKPDGSIDAKFNPDSNGTILALALQPDHKIMVGGSFTTLNGGAITRNNVARLNADGSVDSFDPNANDRVYALAIQAGGRLVIGGYFTTLNGGIQKNYIARLNADGSIDTSFNAQADYGVHALALESDGKIVIGGAFTNVDSEPKSHIARLDTFGGLDTSFLTGAYGYVFTLALQPDGKLVVGGDFSIVASNGGASVARNGIARLYPDGSVDQTLDANANGSFGVSAISFQTDGKILLGGDFTALDAGATPRNHVARLYAGGSVDPNFSPDVNSNVNALAVQPDGKIVVGGWFTMVDGSTAEHIVRVDANGTIDTSFNANAKVDHEVWALAIQPDGRIVIGGNFMNVDGQPRNNIARLYPDGTLDNGFDPNADYMVYALALEPAGKILVGGQFTTLNGATARKYIARLQPDGRLDTSFQDPRLDGFVYALAVQPDNEILLGGGFTSMHDGATPAHHLARLNGDGSFDSTFGHAGDIGADGDVKTIAIREDGEILVGGNFNTLYSGSDSTNDLALLFANGGVDRTIYVDSSVSSAAIAPDGKILIGGDFTEVGGDTRNHVARLSTTELAQQSLTVNGSVVTWKRSGSGPELALPPRVEYSTDGSVYTQQNTMARVSGGWSGTWNLTQPVPSIFYMRVRGTTASGSHNTSQGSIERVRQFGTNSVFHDGFDGG